MVGKKFSAAQSIGAFVLFVRGFLADCMGRTPTGETSRQNRLETRARRCAAVCCTSTRKNLRGLRDGHLPCFEPMRKKDRIGVQSPMTKASRRRWIRRSFHTGDFTYETAGLYCIGDRRRSRASMRDVMLVSANERGPQRYG